jgi:prevent-host-death family protein
MPKKDPGTKNPTSKDDPRLVEYVHAKRGQGWTFALICREGKVGGKERAPYAVVQRIGREYDARHGNPTRIVRTLAGQTHGTGATIIPVRELRNDSARILRQVETGRRFLITVSGHEVAELAPVKSRFVFVPTSVIEGILTEAPLDHDFAADVDAAIGMHVDEL